jgi:hypothetical protein
MPFTLLAAIAILLTASSAAPQRDGIGDLVARLEGSAGAADRDAILALGTSPDVLVDLALALTTPPPTRVVIKERDRTGIEGGGHRLLLEVFWERGIEGRLGTWSVDAVEGSSGWRLSAATRLAHVTGLYRLSLNTARQFDVRNLTVRAPDLALHLRSGSAFVAQTPEGTTAVVLMGNGEAQFSPTDAAERTQLRIFGGNDALLAPFDAAFIRIEPGDFETAFPPGTLVERAPTSNEVRRAGGIFEEYVGKTLQINLQDLSQERWSIAPQPGDLIAEIRTRGHGSLTYTRTHADPEDVTLFDRRRRRNICVYASAEKLAARGRFYTEDDRVDYDVLAYDVETQVVPDRERLEGTTRLKLRIRSDSASTISLRLAEALFVRGVFSPGHGRLLHLRIVNQNSLIVSLPSTMTRGTELWLSITYAGTLPAQELDREAIAVAQEAVDPLPLPVEARYLYSNRTYWYPQSIVSDYATASLRVTVPEGYDVVATGLQTGPPAPPPGVVDGPARRSHVFVADRPVRYLAFVLSRFREVAQTRGRVPGSDEGIPLRILANPQQMSRARSLTARTTEIFAHYASIIGDAPYPALTVALTERELPGGHSPAYFAVVDQPQRGPAAWRNDPVNFDTYPSFFLAHEIAHQWWGQAVGWKNYHEQWLSEGFAQYFATLYAEKTLGANATSNLFRQMRQTAMRQSDKGPIYLGYRLGHIEGDARVFRSILYNKSAMVLHMLRRTIGDEAFFKGVRDFYTTFKFQKAGTGDLIDLMQKASGRDLGPFFDAWIFGSTVPQARFSHRVDGSRLLLRIEQTSRPAPFAVTVRVRYASGRSQDILMTASGAVTEQTVDLTEPLRDVRVNEDHGALVDFR